MSVRVAAVKANEAQYPATPPYHPSERFPEYPFDANLSAEPNHVYTAVRQLFIELGFDKENIGTPEWNPFKNLITQGMTVVLKPNFVRSRHYEGKDPYAMITHPSVLRAVADYCFIALKGSGKIIIADAPQYDGNWEELLKLTGLKEVAEVYKNFSGVDFEIRDLRNYWSRKRHFPSMVEPLSGDPQGILRADLGEESALCNTKDSKRLYGAVYHRKETEENHNGAKQVYELSRTIMDADVVISVPKLKTHKKVGVTMNIKGLVGACTNKNLIVHYSLGSPKEGGDQFPPNHFTPMEERLIKLERWMYDTFLAKQSNTLEYIHRSIYWLHGKFIKPFGIKVEKEKRLLDAGNWYGNDSAWRMATDLLKIFMFADSNGRLHKTQQRKMFSVIDGITGGENKGPLEPDPVASGVLVASDNFLGADIVGTRLMGFNPLKVRTFTYLMEEKNFDYGVSSFEDIEVVSNDEKLRDCLKNKTDRFFSYKPFPGWVGYLEVGKE